MDSRSLKKESVLAHDSVASHPGSDMPARPPRSAILLPSGRAVATLFPLLVILGVTEPVGGWRLAETLAVQCLVWTFAAAVGFPATAESAPTTTAARGAASAAAARPPAVAVPIAPRRPT